MSSPHSTTIRRMARAQRGFTLVELMVTVAIAMFLLAGLVTILQNVRATYANQQSLAQLQDQQRFAMTVLTDVIQAGGYFPDPLGMTPATALPAAGAYQVGQAFTGTQGATDSIGVRYRTANGDGVILCDGSSNTAVPPGSQLYTNVFTVVPPAGAVPGQLRCTLTIGAAANAPLTLITGVQGLTIYYGVKRNPAVVDYNVDTYLTANQMLLAGPNGNDWLNISAVRVILQFNNPLFPQPGAPPHHHHPGAEHVPQLRHPGEDRGQPARERPRAACRGERTAVRRVVADSG
jgi:type IV pilus assembly protein PilW